MKREFAMTAFQKLVVQIETCYKYLLAFLLSIFILGGVLYSMYLGNTLRYPDEQEYYTISRHLLHSQRYSLDGLTSTTARPPFYPFVLSALGLFKAQVFHLRILNFVALAASALILGRIVKKQTLRDSGLLALILVICYPVLFYTAGTLYPQTIGALLLLTSIFLLINSIAARSIPYIAGLIFGCLILTIPSFILTLLCLTVFLLIIGPDRLTLEQIDVRGHIPLVQESKALSSTRIICIFSIIAIIPAIMWSIRNYSVTGRLVFVSSNSGLNLLLGNSENTTPNSGVNVDISKYTAQTTSVDEVDRDKFYGVKAIEWIENNKVPALKLYILKALNYFNYHNQLYVQSESSSLRDILMFITYYPLLSLLFIRILLMKYFPLSAIEKLFIFLYLTNALISAIFFTRVRFRLPFDFLLIGLVVTSLERARLYYSTRMRSLKTMALMR